MRVRGYGFLLRGPAPRGYNGDGDSVAGRRRHGRPDPGHEPVAVPSLCELLSFADKPRDYVTYRELSR
jgi:hypothetical protein